MLPSSGARWSQSVRAGIVVGLSLSGLLWLLGPETALLQTPVEAAMSETSRMLYKLAKLVIFLTVNGVLIYVLLGKLQSFGKEMPRLDKLVQELTTGAAVAGSDGTIMFANPTFLRLFGLGTSVVGQIGIEHLLQGQLDDASPEALLPPAGKVEFQIAMKRDGEPERSVLISILPAGAEGRNYLVYAVDVTELNRLRSRNDLLGASLDTLDPALVVCDACKPGYPVVYLNAATERITSNPAENIVGAPWTMLQGVNHGQAAVLPTHLGLGREAPSVSLVWGSRKDGTLFLGEVQVSSVRDGKGGLTFLVCLVRDVTDQEREREAIDQSLHQDEITSLFSRAGAIRALTALLATPEPCELLVAKIDIRDFHEFNTALGWDAGDALLADIGSRLRRAFPEALLGRVAADQYLLAMPTSEHDAANLAKQLREAVEGPFTSPGLTYDPLFAIGYSVVPRGTSVRAAMQQSSVALKTARSSGLAETRRFDRDTEQKILERRRLTTELQQAVRDRDFVVTCQPVMDLKDGRVQAGQAVLQWKHPLFGLQGPLDLFEEAKETGLLSRITAFNLSEASRLAALFNAPLQPATFIYVRVAQSYLCQPHLLHVVSRCLEAARVPPSWMRLEISELAHSVVSRERPGALAGLRQMGLKVAIHCRRADYDLCRNLESEPVDELTIGQDLIRGVEQAVTTRAVSRAIIEIGLAQGLNLRAMGVETERERDALLDLGCTFGQGLLFGPPVDQMTFQTSLANAGSPGPPQAMDTASDAVAK